MGHFEIPLDVNVASEGEGVFWHRLAVGGLVGFAQGKNEYLPGTVSEVYPEVHRLWDGWVDRILETGVDGIDIRVSSHGSLVDEPWEYGFDEPVVEAHRMKYDSGPVEQRRGPRPVLAFAGAALHVVHAADEQSRAEHGAEDAGAHPH